MMIHLSQRFSSMYHGCLFCLFLKQFFISFEHDFHVDAEKNDLVIREKCKELSASIVYGRIPLP